MMLVHLRQGSSAYSWYNFNLNSFVSLSRAMKYNQEKEVFRQPQMPLSWEESLAGKYLHAQWCLHNCADKSFRYFIISLFSVIISFEDSLKKTVCTRFSSFIRNLKSWDWPRCKTNCESGSIQLRWMSWVEVSREGYCNIATSAPSSEDLLCICIKLDPCNLPKYWIELVHAVSFVKSPRFLISQVSQHLVGSTNQETLISVELWRWEKLGSWIIARRL